MARWVVYRYTTDSLLAFGSTVTCSARLGRMVLSDLAPKQGRGSRPRHVRLEVWLTPDEKAEILERAASAGMSASSFMRSIALNQPIRSVLDLKAVADLGKVNGDLGRVAGLLKLWLAEKRGQGASAKDVERMMIEFRELQKQTLDIMGSVIRDRKAGS